MLENRRIIQRHDATIRPGFEMNAYALFRLVLAAEIIADGLHVESQFICNALRAAAGQFVFDSAQLVKCDNHISWF